MKKTTRTIGTKIAIAVFCAFFAINSFGQVGINTTTPGAGSVLDVNSSEKGVFVPKVNLTDLNSINPITGVTILANAAGLLVYNTSAVTGKGYYYWSGTQWVNFTDGKDEWKLAGNATTTPGTAVGQNYLGTTDAKDLVLATAATERLRVLSNGNVGIGANNPRTSLDVNGGLSLREGTALALVDGANNDIALDAVPHSFYRITGPTTDFTITGIIPAPTADGQLVTLQNTTSQIMTIGNNGTTSSAINRINVPGNKDLLVRGQNAVVTLQYNTTLNRWIVQNEVNHIETYYALLGSISFGSNSFTVAIPGVTGASTASINFVGPVPNSVSNNLLIEYIETKPGNVKFRIFSTSFGTITGGQVAIAVNKI